MSFIVVSLKKNLFTIIFLSFLICLVMFSGANLEAAKNGLTLWANSVLPTLFPFFIATELLYRTNFANILGKFFSKFMKPLFNIPGEGAIAVILGNISGYPIGAKLACELKENKQITKIQAERIIAFTNNSSPLFIIGTVGISMFGNKELGLLLLATHLLASLTVGLIFRNWKKDKETFTETHLKMQQKAPTVTLSNLGEILSDSIKNAINLVLTIGGFIVLFSVIISILESANIFDYLSNFLNNFGIPKEYTKAISCGILELTNGLNYSTALASTNLATSLVISSCLLGFGGFSVLLQVYSVIAKHDLSIKPYLYGKLLQAVLATIYTAIALLAFVM